MNETIKALCARKSVRVFTDQPVAEDIKAQILRAAFEAPTAGNQMLYTILDITDPGVKAQLSVLCDNQPFIAAAPVVLVFLADHRRWLDTYRAAGLSPRAPGLGDALLAVADAVIAAQNAVVAAESFGLGSCYIGDIIENCEKTRALLNLPEEALPAAMLIIGHPTEAQKARRKPKRFDGKYVVFENAYRTLTPEEHREMFREREAAEGRAGDDFEEKMAAFWKRKYESDFSREMSRSARVYLEAFKG